MISITPNMAWFTQLILLSLVSVLKCKECVIDHRTLHEAWEEKLHKDLAQDYMWSENPTECNITEVKMFFLMSSFIMDDKNDVFTTYGVLHLTWTDKKLRWKASDYGGLEKVNFSKLAYWIPFVQQSNGEEDGYWMNSDECDITESGFVHCKLKVEYSTECATKIRNWPYDTQKCTLEFSVIEWQKNVHLIPKAKRAIRKSEIVSTAPDYSIIGYHQEHNTSAVVQIRVIFVLDRNGESLAAMIVLPSILLSILTVSSIVLDVDDGNRFVMILFSMFCHCFYLLEIGWEIPKATDDVPTILYFYRSSFIMTLLIVVATVLLRKIKSKASVPNTWVDILYTTVVNSHGKYFIWPLWKTNVTPEDENIKSVEVWTGFANILNSACFFVTILVYSIMIPVCVPLKQDYTFYPKGNNSVFYAADNY